LSLSVTVIGAGAFGGWAALHLHRRGANVRLLDAWGPGNARASSGGETRIIRATYGRAAIYTRMAAQSLPQWQELERTMDRKLLHQPGALWMAREGDGFESAAVECLKAAGVRHERLTVAESARRWPQIDFGDLNWCLYEPDGGYLLANRCCRVVADALTAEGGAYQELSVRPGVVKAGRMHPFAASDDSEVSSDVYVFACGPWLPSMFPFLKNKITVTKQEVFFFGRPPGDKDHGDESLPVWIDFNGRRFYGIPGQARRGFKIASDERGAEFEPTHGERKVSEAGVQAARDYVGQRFPGLRGAPLLETRVCQYENTATHDFILARHPEAENVWIVGGGSGHGFKHGPAVGELVAQAVLGEGTVPAEFALRV
jgi:glycine/D-amino acid oxidase-like deaminating enzyme